MKSKWRCLGFAPLLIVGFAGVEAPVRAGQTEVVSALLADPAEGKSPGCGLGVLRDGKIERRLGAGLADVDAGQPIGPDTLFYAASLSKQFTALALAQLATAGKLDLDDDVHRYLPELPDYGVAISLRMLMQHTSGIRDFLELGEMSGRDIGADRQQALALLWRQQATNFPPGSEYLYSNGGYLLLSEVVERVSGERFAGYVKRHVLEPLGMRRSFVLDGVLPPLDDLAHGYAKNVNGFEVRDNYPRFGGSGGLMTTVDDLLRYADDLQSGGRVWTPALRQLLLTPGTLADGSLVAVPGAAAAYAGGVMVGWNGGRRVIRHGGAASGFRNFLAVYPDQHLAVVLLCNRGDRKPEELAGKILSAITSDPNFATAPAPKLRPGHYVSDELMTDYELQADGPAWKVAIRPLPDTAAAEVRTVVLEPDGAGAYTVDGYRLTPDPGQSGFVLDGGRAKGIRFRRVDEVPGGR